MKAKALIDQLGGNIAAETDSIPIMSPFGELNMAKKSDKRRFTTHSVEMGFRLTARNFTIVPESFPTQFAGSLGGRLSVDSTFHFRFLYKNQSTKVALIAIKIVYVVLNNRLTLNWLSSYS